MKHSLYSLYSLDLTHSYQKLEEKMSTLEKVSGISIDDLISKFAAGFTLMKKDENTSLSDLSVTMDNYNVIVIPAINIKSCMLIAEYLHNMFKGNDDYIKSNILLNIDQDKYIVKLFIFKECETEIDIRDLVNTLSNVFAEYIDYEKAHTIAVDKTKWEPVYMGKPIKKHPSCREKLKMEYPNQYKIRELSDCPHDYGYAKRPLSCSLGNYTSCYKCWGRLVEDKEN